MAIFEAGEFWDRIQSFGARYRDHRGDFENGDEGLRVVLETRTRRLPGDVQSEAKGLTPVNFSVERMFPGSENQEPSEQFDLARFYLLTIPHSSYEVVGAAAYDYAYSLREKMQLVSAEPDVPFQGFDDARYLDPCWEPEGLEPDDYAWSLRNLRVPQAWNIATSKGQGIRIGHPDTGHANHVDLDLHRLDLGRAYNFINNNTNAQDPLNYAGWFKSPGHGTATGSVIVSEGGVDRPPALGKRGGTTGPGRVTGVAPRADLVPLRAIKSVVRVLSGNVARAVYHATRNDCHVISLSLGGLPSRSLHAAIQDAVRKQKIVIAAAGNCVGWVVFPARYAESIAMAATNIHDKPWKGSSRGGEVAVSAPGEYVWCARRKVPQESTASIDGGQGTSFATANTAGVAALWLGHFGPDAIAEDARQKGATVQSTFRSRLRATARVPDPSWDSANYGAGIVDAKELLAQTPVPLASTYGPQAYQYLGHVVGIVADAAAADAARQMTALLGIPPDSAGITEEFEAWGHELLRILLTHADVFNATVRFVRNEGGEIEMLRAMYARHASRTLADVLRRNRS